MLLVLTASWPVLQDEERLKTSANEAPSLETFNRQLARSDAEFVRFQEMDKDPGAWPGELVAPTEVGPGSAPASQLTVSPMLPLVTATAGW